SILVFLNFKVALLLPLSAILDKFSTVFVTFQHARSNPSRNHTRTKPPLLTSDEALMAAVAHGELERLAELYQRYRSPLFGYLYRQVKGDRSLAEDVLQDTFERIIKYRASYRPNSSFRAWIYTLARNACNDRLRKANRLPCDSDISPKDLPLTTPSILQDLLQKEEIQRVKKALNNLPDKYREVIDLAWKRKMKYAEIGELLSLSEANVKVRVHRAIKHLKANYQKIPE
ncbi:MAG: sigma-70 family RNA polymerase sigma factor, partial [Bacteroidota bacterium]